MLTRKLSRLTDDAQDGSPLFQPQGLPSAYTLVPPTPGSSEGWPGGDREACRLVSVNLAAYLDNELDPDQSDLVDRHLIHCAACAALLETMEETDEAIQREWREGTPLPSSSQFRHSIDAIMDTLPPTPVDPDKFASKRVHARTRWMRFATGMSGFILAAGMIWSSYEIGYAHGRKSVNRSSFGGPTVKYRFTDSPASLILCSLAASDPVDLPAKTPATFSRERRVSSMKTE